jgi:hypothetical protein
MLTRLAGRLAILSLLAVHLSCTALPRFIPESQGGVALVPLTDLASIPREWGNLVTVTVSQPSEGSALRLYLWFQDAEGNVRQAALDPATNQLLPNARLFRRK